jgi:hypothetical protein
MIRRKMLFLFLLSALGLLCASGLASADVTVYTSQAAFDAATIPSSLTSLNFANLPAGEAPSPGGYTLLGYGTLTVNGVSFNSAGGALEVVDPAYDPGDFGYTTNNGRPVLTDNFGGGTGLTITFPTPVTAFGGWWGEVATTASDSFPLPVMMTFTLSNGGAISEPIDGAPTLDFYGFTSSAPISSVSVQDNYYSNYGGSPTLDTLYSGQAVPEPATLTMWSLFGGIGMAVGCWRRRSRKAA